MGKKAVKKMGLGDFLAGGEGERTSEQRERGKLELQNGYHI